MRSLLLATAGILSLAALAQSAAAADLSRRYEPVPGAPVYAPLYKWTGFYVGLNGGGAWGHSRWDSAGGFDVTGGLLGGTIGYDWQTGPLVFGVESDLDWTHIGGSTTSFCPLGCKTSNSWLGTVRGRVGYAVDRIMPYVTGGLAFGNIKASTPGLPEGMARSTSFRAPNRPRLRFAAANASHLNPGSATRISRSSKPAARAAARISSPASIASKGSSPWTT